MWRRTLSDIAERGQLNADKALVMFVLIAITYFYMQSSLIASCDSVMEEKWPWPISELGMDLATTLPTRNGMRENWSRDRRRSSAPRSLINWLALRKCNKNSRSQTCWKSTVVVSHSIVNHRLDLIQLSVLLCRFLSDKAQIERIRASFAGLWGLEHEEEVKRIIDMVKERPTDFVLKPQREGGGTSKSFITDDVMNEPFRTKRKQHLWRRSVEEPLDDGRQDASSIHPDGED